MDGKLGSGDYTIERTHMQYLVFTKMHKDSKMITDQWYITPTNREHDVIGYISYYNPWRKYVFYSENKVLFDNQCLGEIIKFLDKINEERKERLKKEKEIESH